MSSELEATVEEQSRQQMQQNEEEIAKDMKATPLTEVKEQMTEDPVDTTEDQSSEEEPSNN